MAVSDALADLCERSERLRADSARVRAESHLIQRMSAEARENARRLANPPEPDEAKTVPT